MSGLRVYLVYIIFLGILSVVLVPLVKKAVFVAFYRFVIEMVLTKLTLPFRKTLKFLQISLLQHIEPLEHNSQA